MKWFNPEKGYGFIARDSGGKDVFVHISALERSGITSSRRRTTRDRRCCRGPKGTRSRKGALGLGRGRRGSERRMHQAIG